MALNKAFRDSNDGGYFDRERQENPLLFDDRGEPLDRGYAQDDFDPSAPSPIKDT